jgi:hypothetical protein
VEEDAEGFVLAGTKHPIWAIILVIATCLI